MKKNKSTIFEINPRLSSTVMMRYKLGFKDCLWWINFYLLNKTPNLKTIKFKKKKILRIYNEVFV